MPSESKTAPHLRRWRAWIDPFLAIMALAVSAISLWVAIGTEDANRKMVAAASWPLLQADTSNLNSVISFSILNGGVGPAKLETFELLWNGKTYAGADALLAACCGFHPSGARGITTGGVNGVVIRAGEKHLFLAMPLTARNAEVWRTLDRRRGQFRYRACYCSVFDECWVSNLVELQPKRTRACPAVKTPYIQQ